MVNLLCYVPTPTQMYTSGKSMLRRFITRNQMTTQKVRRISMQKRVATIENLDTGRARTTPEWQQCQSQGGSGQAGVPAGH